MVSNCSGSASLSDVTPLFAGHHTADLSGLRSRGAPGLELMPTGALGTNDRVSLSPRSASDEKTAPVLGTDISRVPIMSHLLEIAAKYFRSKQTCSASNWLRGLAAAYGNATGQIETVEVAAQPPVPRDGLVFDDASTLISINLRARTAGQ